MRACGLLVLLLSATAVSAQGSTAPLALDFPEIAFPVGYLPELERAAYPRGGAQEQGFERVRPSDATNPDRERRRVRRGEDAPRRPSDSDSRPRGDRDPEPAVDADPSPAVSVTPEPASLVLLATGIAVLGYAVRRRRTKTPPE